MTAAGDARITLVVVDDHRIIIESMEAALARHPDLVVLGTASDADGAVEAVRTLRPDVVLLDYQLGPAIAPDVIPLLLAAAPVKIVVLTAHPAQRVLVRCLRAGARGYASKEQSVSEIVDVIRAVHSGVMAVAPEVLAAVMEDAPADGDTTVALSARELEVLALVAVGHSNQEIANRMFLSVNTVRNHVAAILDKLGVRSRVEAAAMYHQGRVVGSE